MGVEARLRALLRNVLSSTWIAVASLAVAVAGDVLAAVAPLPALLCLVAAPIGSVVGAIVSRSRVQGKGVLAGVLSTGICIYAGLVSLFLCSTAFMIS